MAQKRRPEGSDRVIPESLRVPEGPGKTPELADLLQGDPEHADLFVELIRDEGIDQETAAETVRELVRRSTIDRRTGLKNDTALLGFNGDSGELKKMAERMERESLDVPGPKRFAIVLVDIENFKSINRAFGQRQGNQTLRDVGKGFRESLRPGDDAYRLGGGADEFALILPEVDDPETAEKIALRTAGKFPKHPVTGKQVTFNAEKIAVEIYDTRKHRPGDAIQLLRDALDRMRAD